MDIGWRRLSALGAVVATVLALLCSTARPAAGAAHPVSCAITRAEEYPRAEASSVGLDPAALRAAVGYWVEQGAENLKVFRHGCLVAEGTLDAATDDVPRQNWSQTKTVSALIAGVAVREHVVRLDAPIGRYLPRGVGDAAHRAITIRQVLTMTSGLQLDPIADLALSADLTGPPQAMSMRLAHRPGTYFEYDQNAASLLNWTVASALRRAGRGDYLAFAQRELFGPLGIPADAYLWQRDPTGTPMVHAGLLLPPADFGRLGELLRGDGVFDGQRLIDAGYLRRLRTGTKPNCGYGFLVWLNGCTGRAEQVNASIGTRQVISPARPWITTAPPDMYYSWGAHGQHIFVIPSLDLVVTRSGERDPDNDWDTEHLDPDLIWNGNQQGGYAEFLRLLMAAVR
jgi:CubicO group peptidase (beta-lactamase class C family)